MQKNTFFDKVSALSPTTKSHKLTINTEGDKKNEIPPMSIAFEIKTTEDNAQYMHFCHVQILDRSSDGMKAYPMEDVGVKVYYNKKNQVCAIDFISQEIDDDRKPSSELVDLFCTLKDAEALQAYRMAAWYWIILDNGYGVMNGHYTLVDSDEFDIDTDTTDYPRDTLPNWEDTDEEESEE